jgi:putative lysine transport system substrate-binding protein
MKKVLAVLITVILALSACAPAAPSSAAPAPASAASSSEPAPAADGGVLRVGMECNYAPFNWTQSNANDRTVPITSGGYADGYDVQVARKIADGLGKKLEIVKIEWDGLTLAVQSGEIDAIIAGMSPTAERALTIDFTEPYYESELVVVVKKDSPYASAKALADLSGAKITAQLNTFHYTVIDQIPGVVKQTAMETFPAMIVALSAGSIDGYISERPGAVSAVASNPDLTYVEFSEGSGFEASPEDVAVAVGLKKGSDLRDGINKILADISKEDRQQMMDEAVDNQPLSQYSLNNL